MHDDDVSLLGGSDWTDVIEQALTEVSEAPEQGWSDIHAPVLPHPLSPLFPNMAEKLDMSCLPIGGDNDTVFAKGYAAGEGPATKYSALARTIMDVGDWSNCRWIVFQGSSGAIGNPHRTDQHRHWAAGETVPMLYDWSAIEACADTTILIPADLVT